MGDGGQFNVNGQRANANYWMVDGVSANIGLAASGAPGNGFSGSLGSFNATGGTNSLVSVDALQEFRIQTSTYAPEFGRTPGGQISIVTRSGTNQFHGTLFEYLRNDVFDANNWFADHAGLPKPRERQNDFGGTAGGPVAKNRTFFFFSYEGLRLRLPQTLLTTVPDLAARENAVPALQPFFNAFPLPNGPDDPVNGMAPFNSSFSNPATLDAYSLRIDHRFRRNISLFARYNFSPSEVNQRSAGGGQSLNVVFPARIRTQTATAAMVALFSTNISNDLRLNYSQTNSFNAFGMDKFGGAEPLTNPPFPGGFGPENADFFFDIFSLTHGAYEIGKQAENAQRQWNLVDNISLQKGAHTIKVGADYRRLAPHVGLRLYSQAVAFDDVAAAENGNVSFALFGSSSPVTTRFQNLGIFAQDTWKASPRLTLTYGARWDLDFAPSSLEGPSLPAVTGFNLQDLTRLALAPQGTAPFKTTYGNFAPRIGVAYQLVQAPDHETVLRGGFGVFYDLATGEIGNVLSQSSYPFGAEPVYYWRKLSLRCFNICPPAITVASLSGSGSSPLTALDPNLRLPYTLEWNLALEQSIGRLQSISASYIGSAGRRLLQTAVVSSPNPDFNSAYLVTNAATADYGALQLQYKRQLRNGLEMLASYAWSHSIDTASAASTIVGSNTFEPENFSGTNRGPSDFDLRHAASVAATYEVPYPGNLPAKVVFGGWSIQNVLHLNSATPVNVYEADFAEVAQFSTQVRPDLVAGQSPYLFGSIYPGGKALNPDAFMSPPLDADGNPTRQGKLGRNALRGFGLVQWDLGFHREFHVRGEWALQFRAEMFNVLNHPNFGPPESGIGRGGFGTSSMILSEALAGNVGAGGFNALYQLGGPRSVQFALKLQF